jgi:hypothetical protein
MTPSDDAARPLVTAEAAGMVAMLAATATIVTETKNLLGFTATPVAAFASRPTSRR